MLMRSLQTLLLCLPLATASAAQGELRMLAPLNHVMPLARFHDHKLDGGILKDLGDAIARRMGRRAVYVSVAVDQVGPALEHGKADGLCYARPFWIDGDFDWSRPLIPDAELVASALDAPVVASLLDLRDRPVGTVAGYRYPRVEQVLGLRFQRRDAATMEQSLRAMTAGSTRHTVLNRATMLYQLKHNKSLKLRADLVLASFTAQCAFSKRSKLAFGDVDRAINTLIDDGSVEAILERYR